MYLSLRQRFHWTLEDYTLYNCFSVGMIGKFHGCMDDLERRRRTQYTRDFFKGKSPIKKSTVNTQSHICLQTWLVLSDLVSTNQLNVIIDQIFEFLRSVASMIHQRHMYLQTNRCVCTVYTRYVYCIPGVGTFFGLWMCTLLKIPDMLSALLVLLIKFPTIVMCALTTQSHYFYVASAINMFGCCLGPLVRSYLSKIVPKQDLGK